jgi:hypothetical protein
VLTAAGVPAATGDEGMTVAEARATFVRPARVRRYGEYVVLVWARDENLLGRLR